MIDNFCTCTSVKIFFGFNFLPFVNRNKILKLKGNKSFIFSFYLTIQEGSNGKKNILKCLSITFDRTFCSRAASDIVGIFVPFSPFSIAVSLKKDQDHNLHIIFVLTKSIVKYACKPCVFVFLDYISFIINCYCSAMMVNNPLKNRN